MNLPEGRESSIHIDSSLMLKEPTPVIGTGEWDDLQCRYFKNSDGHGLLIGDIVLVREGKKPLAIVQVTGDNFLDANLTSKYINQNFREVRIIGWFNDKEEFPQPQGTLQKLINKRTDSYIFIKNWHRKMMEENNKNNKIELLKSKFQIILQGPPGTGKTRLAKQLAKQIIGFDKSSYSEESLKSALSIGMQIPNASGVADYYTVKEIKNASVVLSSERATQDWEPQFSQILKKLSELEQGISPENKKGLHPYELAVAKYLYKNVSIPTIQEEQMELIQFHPSYTYEDFVRGIEAKANDVGIEYRTIDKVLSKLAKKANDNWIDFHSNPEDVNRKEWVQNKLSEYLSQYSESLASSAENKLMLTDSIYVYQVDEDCLRYKGDEWASPSRINFTELSDLILHNLETPEEIEIPKTISNHAYYRRSYYGSVLRSFFEFAGPYNAGAKNSLSLKNYVLIIDEINRANLPSVLGELIYALEYRGESVNSMYELNGDSKITLPKNLFIIGTMNTADRSVGHIDYAIRRRFAFIDILPTDEPIESQEGKELFKKVTELFIKVEDGGVKSSDHLSPDFNFKEVQIGHSYFICDVEQLKQRLDFEIRPILREYLKDGILLSSAEELVETLSV